MVVSSELQPDYAQNLILPVSEISLSPKVNQTAHCNRVKGYTYHITCDIGYTTFGSVDWYFYLDVM